MGMMVFLKKSKAQELFAETTFECKRGDLIIRGTEYRPAGENLPAAIVSHGFMAWQDTVRPYAKELAQMGYCAYCFDFCGGSVMNKGKSDGATTDMSALVASKHPGLVDQLVLFYPALCIPDDARAGKMMLAKFDPKNIPERLNCGPMKLGRCYVADVIEMDPIQEISSYHGPVLIVHGTKDNIVKLDYSRQAQRAYPNAKLHIIEGGAHGFGKKHDEIAIAHLRRFAGRNEK